MPITDAKRHIGLINPLGKDLLLHSCNITETLGRMFSIRLDLRSENFEIDFNKIVGQNVTIWLNLLNGSVRHFNGYVNAFMQELSDDGVAHYSATVVPWLWFLTRTADSRIFQHKKVPDIIKQIFRNLGFTDFKDSLSGAYREWEYCVQYRETDFNFVSRLMEQEGIYYYFEHEKSSHTVVMTDAKSSHKPYPDYGELKYLPSTDAMSTADEFIRYWSSETAIQPGAFVQRDYDFKIPGKDLTTNKEIASDHVRSDYEIYDYHGEYKEKSDGDNYSNIRIEELHTQHEVHRGESDARGIATGCIFTLKQYPRKDWNKNYLITSSTIYLQSDEFQTGQSGGQPQLFSCTFEAIDSTIQFRSERATPKPSVNGPQTAFVVGPSGDEIYTDQYGRVKVHFHWDRESQKDENSSCWIRVSQSWAGSKWGAMHIPRIGQEVIVEFIEGDPDHPIITGRVYNGKAMPPYDLPAEKTKSTVKSNSTKGGAGFNELRFEDKKGEEQIFIHAERNMDTRVKNDSLERIYGNRHQVIGWEKDGKKGGDQREMIYMDKHLKVHRNDTTHIGGDMQLLVGGIDGDGNQDIVIKADKKELIEKNHHLHVKQDRTEKIDGTQSLTIGGDQQEKVGMNHALDAGNEIHLKAGMKIIIEAGLQISLKVGGNFVDIGPAGVTIQGTLVRINSGGAAGAGSGSQPGTPADAKEAGPTEPGMADNAKPGKVDKVP